MNSRAPRSAPTHADQRPRDLGDCRNVSYGQIWDRMRTAYGTGDNESYLRDIHLRWKKLGAGS